MSQFDRGQFPTPTAINQALGHRHRVKMNMLNGEETRGRTVALQEAGYFKHPVSGRWRSHE